MTLHETHRCRDCDAEITIPYATGTMLVPTKVVVEAFEEIATFVGSFLEDAANGPWRPESPVTGEGLSRRKSTIWLTNDDGDGLAIDEETAANLVEALRLVQLYTAPARRRS